MDLPISLKDDKYRLRKLVRWMTQFVKQPILLFVDELMKLEEAASTVTTEIGNCLTTPEFEAVISTVNANSLIFQRTGSFSGGRRVVWIPLSPLSLDESYKIFESFPLNDEAKLAISDCNRHPRSLECIWRAMAAFPSNESFDYRVVIEKAIKDWGQRSTRITESHLRLALLGSHLQRTDEAGCKAVGDIATGVFLNSTAIDNFIPSISPFALRLFAKEAAAESQIGILLNDLLFNDDNMFGWKEFEKFHCIWECLKRQLLSETLVNLGEFYHDLNKPDWPSFIVKKKRRQPLKTNFADAAIKSSWLDSRFFVPVDGNPGFDLLSFEIEHQTKETFAVCIECRFSQPESSTVLSKHQVLQKYKLAVSQITGKIL